MLNNSNKLHDRDRCHRSLVLSRLLTLIINNIYIIINCPFPFDSSSNRTEYIISINCR